jgi:hypothetical protein
MWIHGGGAKFLGYWINVEGIPFNFQDKINFRK